MPIIVKCAGSAFGEPMGVEGHYLKDFDLEAFGGVGRCAFTADPAAAKRWPGLVEFTRDYKSVPLCRPLRADGKPNRPLTATHWEIVSVPE